jgi:mRNA-degrading endonuclease RelE of RelBE toxin-antitoxin system
MTDCYAIKIRRVVFKQLARIPTIHRKRIEIAIDQLSQTPYPHGCKKLVGEAHFGAYVSAIIA